MKHYITIGISAVSVVLLISIFISTPRIYQSLGAPLSESQQSLQTSTQETSQQKDTANQVNQIENQDSEAVAREYLVQYSDSIRDMGGKFELVKDYEYLDFAQYTFIPSDKQFDNAMLILHYNHVSDKAPVHEQGVVKNVETKPGWHVIAFGTAFPHLEKEYPKLALVNKIMKQKASLDTCSDSQIMNVYNQKKQTYSGVFTPVLPESSSLTDTQSESIQNESLLATVLISKLPAPTPLSQSSVASTSTLTPISKEKTQTLSAVTSPNDSRSEIKQELKTELLTRDQSDRVSIVFSPLLIKDVVLERVISASGVRYANTDESVVWWTKGTDATLYIKDRIVFEGVINARCSGEK
jgi:membrane-bound inhibitor of C-type lysozyme